MVKEPPNSWTGGHELVGGDEAVVGVAAVVGPDVVEGVDSVGVLEEELGGKGFGARPMPPPSICAKKKNLEGFGVVSFYLRRG